MPKSLLVRCLALCVVAASLVGCGGSKVPVANKTIQEGNELARQGRWTEALAKYSSPGANAKWDSTSYRWATIAAVNANSDSLAALWGTRFPSNGDTLKSAALATAYQRLGDQQRRDSLLVTDARLFEGVLGRADVTAARARTYARNGDEKLVQVFHRLDDKALKVALFDDYFKLANGKDTEALIAKECKAQLAAEPDNVRALRFLGKAKYEQAEKLYKKAMDDYNKKKTQASYAYLARDLKKVISPLYREARDYFEALAKLQPDDKNPVRYLVNIYRRLDNEQKAKQLEKKL